MNLEQLHTGTVHIGYFFLLAIVSGILGYILMAIVQPLERFWITERRKYGVRYHDDDDLKDVPKKVIIWGWFRRHGGLLNRIHQALSISSTQLTDPQHPKPYQVSVRKIVWVTIARESKASASRLRQRFVSNFRRSAGNSAAATGDDPEQQNGSTGSTTAKANKIPPLGTPVAIRTSPEMVYIGKAQEELRGVGASGTPADIRASPDMVLISQQQPILRAIEPPTHEQVQKLMQTRA